MEVMIGASWLAPKGWMIPTPWSSVRVALTGLLRLTKNDSLDSLTASLKMLIEIVCEVTSGAKTRLPDCDA